MRDLRTGPPVDRSWVLWHGLIGLGCGLLFIPVGPPFWLMMMFLLSSLIVMAGVRFTSRKIASFGLAALVVPLMLRAVFIWRADSLGAGSRSLATFVWAMLAVGSAMEAYSVKRRGIS